jgi:hypothetical protein
MRSTTDHNEIITELKRGNTIIFNCLNLSRFTQMIQIEIFQAMEQVQFVELNLSNAQKKPDREGYDPEAYNQEREEYMIEKLSAISNNHPNHHIIFPVGASHIENISVALKARSVNVVIDNSANSQENSLRNPEGTAETSTGSSEFMGDLKSVAESAIKDLGAVREKMQKRKTAKKPEELEITVPKKPHMDELETQESGGRGR